MNNTELKEESMLEKKTIFSLKLIFIVGFIFISIYIIFIKTEKFTSSSIVIIKDLSQKQSTGLLSNLLVGNGSSVVQDSELLNLYINSYEMFNYLDKEYNLSSYYSSQKIDFIQRLYPNSSIEYIALNSKNLMKMYQNDIFIFYDELSNSLKLSFKHFSPKIAQNIVKSVIKYSTLTLNRLEKENSTIALNALIMQEKENKKIFKTSIKELLEYQNKHHTIDPNVDVQAKSAILASLEGKLIQKEIEYKSKLKYLNPHIAQMKIIEGMIIEFKKNIINIEKHIAGKGDNKLNKNVSKFELLKSEVDFNKERYTQTLIKLEDTKVLIKQNAKSLIVVIHPSLANSYDEPKKLKDIISLLIILTFMYSIVMTILSILKDHKD